MLTTRRRAFTLIELAVVIALLGVLAAALMRVVIGQQRFYARATEVIAVRTTLRQGPDVLESELRGLSPADSDIYAMTRSSIEFRAPAGASVVCTVDSSRTMVGIPPSSPAASLALTSWIAAPVHGDSVLVYDAGADPGPADDQWRKRMLAADPTRGAPCPTTTGFTSSPSEAASAWTLRLTSPLETTIAPGAALRFFRRARYQLYQGSDTRWYLGYSDCLASRGISCSTLQPVSGPYAADGLRFTYLDSLAATTSDPARVARIDVLAWAESHRAIHDARGAVGRFRDSLASSIALRH